MKEVVEEIILSSAADEVKILTGMQEIEALVASYTDNTLDIHLLKKQQEELDAEADRVTTKIGNAYNDIRRKVIEGIKNNEPNAAQLKEFVLQLIANEKKHGLYEASDWEDIAAEIKNYKDTRHNNM